MGKLEPVDYKRCQGERSNGFTAFSLGGEHQWIRCENKPIWLAIEKKPGKDGLIGKMSVCEPCAKILEKMKPGYAKFNELRVK